MADTVNVQTVFDGIRRQVVHLTNESDGTGESAVAKVDISTKTDGAGETATHSTIDYIEYAVQGFNYVTLAWSHTTPDEIAVLSGNGVIDWSGVWGMTDPQSAGGTGDLQLTTDVGIDGASYDITLHYRPTASCTGAHLWCGAHWA